MEHSEIVSLCPLKVNFVSGFISERNLSENFYIRIMHDYSCFYGLFVQSLYDILLS